MVKKNLHDLTADEFRLDPVWTFTDSNPGDECEVVPVRKSKYPYLQGLIIAAEVELADGTKCLAIHFGVKPDRILTTHFMSLTIEHEGKWFNLCRYHDPMLAKQGPKALAKFLGKKLKDVFPIKYDLREVLHSDSMELTGVVKVVPDKPITREQFMSLLFELMGKKY